MPTHSQAGKRSALRQGKEALISPKCAPVFEVLHLAVTHPGHDALHQETGTKRQTARTIEVKELLHVLQALTKDALQRE